MSSLDLGRCWQRNLPRLGEAMLRGGVQAMFHPHLPLLPPGKAGSLAAGNETTSTLKVCLPQELVAAGACAGAPILGNDGEAARAWEIIWRGGHLTDGELSSGGGDLPEVLKAEESRLVHSWGLQVPYPELGLQLVPLF